MNRWRMRLVAVLAVVMLAAAGCNDEPSELPDDPIGSPGAQ